MCSYTYNMYGRGMMGHAVGLTLVILNHWNKRMAIGVKPVPQCMQMLRGRRFHGSPCQSDKGAKSPVTRSSSACRFFLESKRFH